MHGAVENVLLLATASSVSTAAGIAPYMALELASYDLMPSDVPAFAKGVTAALFATSICYPLDTVRYVWHQRAVHSFLLHVRAVIQRITWQAQQALNIE